MCGLLSGCNALHTFQTLMLGNSFFLWLLINKFEVISIETQCYDNQLSKAQQTFGNRVLTLKLCCHRQLAPSLKAAKRAKLEAVWNRIR